MNKILNPSTLCKATLAILHVQQKRKHLKWGWWVKIKDEYYSRWGQFKIQVRNQIARLTATAFSNKRNCGN